MCVCVCVGCWVLGTEVTHTHKPLALTAATAPQTACCWRFACYGQGAYETATIRSLRDPVLTGSWRKCLAGHGVHEHRTYLHRSCQAAPCVANCGVCVWRCVCCVVCVGVSHLAGGGGQPARTHMHTHTHATHTGFAATVQGVSDHTLGAGLCGSMMTLPARKPCTIAMVCMGVVLRSTTGACLTPGTRLASVGFISEPNQV